MQYHDEMQSRLTSDGREREYDEAEAEESHEETHEEALSRVANESFRDAAIMFCASLEAYSVYVLNHSTPRMAMYIISYALQLGEVARMTLDDVGKVCGLKTRQMVDSELQKFIQFMNEKAEERGTEKYLPSGGMKSNESSKSYRHARKMSLLGAKKESQ